MELDNTKCCTICGIQISPERKQYCSLTCIKRAYKWRKLGDEEMQKRITEFQDGRDCIVCGKKVQKNKTSNYCSIKCKYKEHYRKRNEKQPKVEKEIVISKCVICEKDFEKEHVNHLCCSNQCASNNRRWKNLSEDDKKEKFKLLNKSVVFNCKHCNNVINRWRIDNTLFCSRKCHADYNMEQLKLKKNICYEFLEQCKKEAGQCAECDETNIRLFEFAHYDRSFKTIDMSHCKDLDKIKEELLVGRWLCINCHRTETLNEVPRDKNPVKIRNREYVNDVKLAIGCCKLCNIKVTETTTHHFEFDHVDQSTKSNEIAQLMNRNINIIKAEIEKCRLLCCKCHRLHSIEQQYENLRKKAEMVQTESC